jgi:predicted Co/Zn/Cd cation transporter (cation efflux family)
VTKQDALDYQSQIKLLTRSISFSKILIYFGIPSGVIIVCFGVIFQAIFFGLAIGVFGLALIWNPAYQLLIRILRLNHLPANLYSPRKMAYFSASIQLLTAIIIIGGCLYVIFQMGLDGLCGQNFICLLYLISRG